MDNKKILANLDMVCAGIALVVLIVVTFGGVIFRYLLDSPIIWAEEVQLWCFLWVTFLGSGAAFRYGSHVAIEIVYELLPKAAKKILDVIIYVIVMGILIYLLILGGDLLDLMVKIGKTTSILQIPMWFINGIIPVGCILMMVSYTYSFYQGFFVKKDEAPAVSKEA